MCDEMPKKETTQLDHYFSSRMSVFDCATPSPPIEVFQFGREFAADSAEEKVSLGLGAYRTDEGKPWIRPCVKKAESFLASQVEEEKITHEYLPVLGLDGR